MEKYITLAGMDVHARSISVRVLNKKTGEISSRKFTDCPSAIEVAEWLLSFPGPVYAAYESGCTGFHLARNLRDFGIDCDVIAISTLPKSDKDKKQKCDKLDAKVILHEISSKLPRYSVVAIPDVQLEGDKELGRAWRDAQYSLKQAKQQLLSFLLKQNHVYNEKTPGGRQKKYWNRSFWKWLSSICFEAESTNLALEHYIRKVNYAQQEADAMKALVCEAAEKPRNKPYVDAISRIKGIDVASAYIARVEIGKFSRFLSGRKVSCWLGVIPTNSSSGDGEVHGKITRAGNSTLRCMLTECVSSIPLWAGTGKKDPDPAGVSAKVLGMAFAASGRMYKRYRYLTTVKGKHSNKAKIAVVNELIRWIWAIGCEVEKQLATKTVL